MWPAVAGAGAAEPGTHPAPGSPHRWRKAAVPEPRGGAAAVGAGGGVAVAEAAEPGTHPSPGSPHRWRKSALPEPREAAAAVAAGEAAAVRPHRTCTTR